MKLYYSRNIGSDVPQLIINEVGANCEVEVINKENYGELKSLNSSGGVPVLQMDNGDALSNLSIILQFLSDMGESGGMIPASGYGRYRTIEINNYIASSLHRPLAVLYSSRKMSERATRFRKRQVHRALKRMDALLKDNKYIAGENLTYADFYLFACVRRVWLTGGNREIFPNLNRHYEEIKGRPSVQKVFKERVMN